MTFWKEQLQLLKAFVKTDFQKLIKFSALAMAAAIALGAVLGAVSPDIIDQAVTYMMQVIEEAGVIDESGYISVFALLNNNWSAMLTSILYGLIPFMCFPVFSLLTNGLLLGVLGAWYVSSGLSLTAYLAGILPHGIFEIPALVLSISGGLYLCRCVTARFTHREGNPPITEVAGDLLRVLLLMIAPLVVAAAFVECYVTPLIMSLFL